MERSEQPQLLVVADSDGSAIPTVEYALREARDCRAERDTDVEVRVTLISSPDDGIGEETESAIVRTVDAFGGDGGRTHVDRVRIRGDDRPSRTAAFLETIDERSLSRLVVPADTRLSVRQLRRSIGGGRVELATTEASRSRRRLVQPRSARRLAMLFGLSYLFYLAIGGFAGGLDLLTGGISAVVVALSLSHVAFSDEPTLRRTGPRLARFTVYLPVLLWEIAKANVAIAYTILHPRLPIDTSMGTVETETSGGLERMVLATSITLTPGTLVVDVHEREFTVHSLTGAAEDELVGGRLERLVGWVFHGASRTDTDGGNGQ